MALDFTTGGVWSQSQPPFLTSNTDANPASVYTLACWVRPDSIASGIVYAFGLFNPSNTHGVFLGRSGAGIALGKTTSTTILTINAAAGLAVGSWSFLWLQNWASANAKFGYLTAAGVTGQASSGSARIIQVNTPVIGCARVQAANQNFWDGEVGECWVSAGTLGYSGEFPTRDQIFRLAYEGPWAYPEIGRGLTFYHSGDNLSFGKSRKSTFALGGFSFATAGTVNVTAPVLMPFFRGPKRGGVTSRAIPI